MNSVSHHFERRWRERVRTEPPGLPQLREMCLGGQLLKHGECLLRVRGGRLVPWRTCTWVWVWEEETSQDLILWIDPLSGRAITVIPKAFHRKDAKDAKK